MSYKAGALALLAVFGAACGANRQSQRVDRIALLHVDDLTTSPLPQWTRVAVPALAAAALATAPDRFAYVSASTNDAWLNRPSRLIRGYMLDGPTPGKLLLRIVEQDAKSGRDVARYEIAGASPVEVGEGLAKRLWPQAKFDPEIAGRLNSGAVASALQMLSARITPNVPLDQAAATAANRPADSRLAALAGRYAMVQRDYKQAGRWFERALRIDPDNGPLHNEAAYVEFFTGSPDAALKNVALYERTDPRGGNPPDSRGEILLLANRFGEAEEAFQTSYTREPRFLGSLTLRKAAIARRSAGDLAGADEVFKKFMDAIAGNHLADLYQAQWDFECGRDAQAFERLEKLGSSIAFSQLGVWRRNSGDAAKALRLAQTDVERTQARIAAWVAHPEVLPDIPPGEIKALVLALRGDHQLAIPELTALIAQTPPPEATQFQVLLAWALAQSGQGSKAKALVDHHPLPSPALSLTESVVLRRYGALRKMAL